MSVPVNITDISATAASNSPAGSDAVGTSLDDFLRAGFAFARQLFDTANIWAGTAGGTANALTLTPSPAITAYKVGQSFTFKAGASGNSSATTVAISGLSTIAIQKSGNALVGGEILANQFYRITLDTASTSQLEVINSAVSGANSDITSLSALASINGGQLAGFRNRIINGGMQVAQRGSVACINGSTYGGADRILITTTATSIGSGTIAAVADSWSPTRKSQSIANLTTTGATTVSFRTRLEADNVIDLNSKTITVSGWLWQDTGSTQTASIFLSKPTALDNWTSEASIGTVNVSVPSSTPTYFTANFTLGSSDATNGLGVSCGYNAISAVTTKNFYLGGLQLELGSVATPFEMRSLAIEKTLCARYLPVVALAPTYISGGQCFSATDPRQAVYFPVPARVSPTGFTLTAGTLGFCNAGGVTTGTVTFNTASTSSAELNASGASGLVAGNATSLMPSTSSNLLFTGCEL